jgi:hypothetical protein
VSLRTKRPVDSPFRRGYTHAAGSAVHPVEPLDPHHRDFWVFEIRVPDDAFEGGAWYDYVELHVIDDLEP